MLSAVRGWLFRVWSASPLSTHTRRPEEYLNTLFLQVQKQLAEARQVTAAAVAREKRCLAELDAQRAKCRTREDSALQALQEGDEARARRETHHWRRERDYQRALEGELRRHRESAETLRKSLHDLAQRTAEAERSKAVVAERLRHGASRERVVAVLRDLGPVSSPEAFNLIEDLSRPVPERDPIGETAALTDPTEAEMLEDLRKRVGDTSRS